MISLYTVQVEPSIVALFAQAPAVTRIFAFQDGKWISATREGEQWSGQLTQMADGKGYWVYANDPVTLGLRPTLPDPLAPPPSYALAAGWNLIGYTSSLANLPVDSYLNSLEGKWTSVYRYAPGKGWEVAKPGALGFGEMQAGVGYWVYLAQAATLVP